MIKTISCIALLAALCIPALAVKQASSFRDVPPDHWAVEAVKQMGDSGIMVGYPDAKFRGDKPVTRYELAITLQRFVHFVEASRAPLVKRDKNPPSSQKPSRAAPAKSDSSRSRRIDGQARTSLTFLINGDFIPKDTLLAKEGAKPIDTELLSQALTSVVSRLAVLEADRQTQTDDSVKHK